jgi:hypothetical protein
MHARDPGGGMTPDDTLGAALRALPQASPPVDLWPGLARRLQPAPARTHRYALPVALAASLLLGLVVSRSVLRDITPPAELPTTDLPTAVAAATPPPEIEQLRARSRDIEGWIGALAAQSPRDGRTLMAAAEIEDLVGFVDVQLSAARDDPEALPLWRQRVALLEDLAVLRSGPQPLLAGHLTDTTFQPTSL